jgi:hypothetical protein
MIRTLAAMLLVAVASAGDGPDQAAWQLRTDGTVVHANGLTFLTLGLRDLSARPVMTGGVLTFEDIRASGYGGEFTGRIAIVSAAASPDGRLRYRGELSVTGVEFAAYLRSLGIDADTIGGVVSGQVSFDMPAGKIDELTGRGTLHIERANFIQFNWLANIISGDVVGRRGEDNARVVFELGPDDSGRGRIRLNSAIIDSPAMKVVASGTMDYEWSLDLLLQASPDGGIFKKTLGWALGGIFSPLTTSLLTYRMRGRITEPVLIHKPFGE